MAFYLIYNSIFNYRIIAICNDGNLKYKEPGVTCFSRPPFSIINPFKKQKLINKIRDYCTSEEFATFHALKNYQTIEHRDFFIYRKFAAENSLRIKAVKDENNFLLILVSKKTDSNLDLVFQFDKTTEEIVGYF